MLIHLLVLVPIISAKTLSMRSELTKHFDSSVSSPAQQAEITRIMRNIQKLAIRDFYGAENANLDLVSDNDTQVSISMTHPGQSVALSQLFFEGDMLLNSVQALEIYHALLHKASTSPSTFRAKRQLYPRPTFLWDRFPIKYHFGPLLGGVAKQRIEKAIKMWEKQTCITFEQVDVPTGDYLEFFNGQGCYSMVGKQGGKQGISVGKGCEHEGIIAHEIGHALGLWHEQSRPDRDNFVRVVPQNIIRAMAGNFLVRHERDIEYHGTQYDIGSIMHFGPYAFTNEFDEPTLETVQSGYQKSMGQRDQLSFYDIQMINREYCEDTCINTLTCYWGGYPDPKDCTRCICPDGMGGRLCERNQDPINANCGYQVLARKTWREISSPGYPSPGYDVDQKCSWVIRAPGRRRILMEFVEDFDIFCTDTCLDYVEIKNSTEIRNTGMRFCCNEIPEQPIISEGSVLVVIFRSTTARKPGFKLRFRQVPEAPIDLSALFTDNPTTIEQTTTTQAQTTTLQTTQPPTTEPPIITISTTSKPETTTPVTIPPTIITTTTTTEIPTSSIATTTTSLPPTEPTTSTTTTEHPTSSPATFSPTTPPSTPIPTPSQPLPPIEPTDNNEKLQKPTLPDVAEELWEEWAEWSGCSESCGGCGTQKRTRACHSGTTCRGSPNDYRQCNFEACPDDTTCRVMKDGEECKTTWLQYCFKTQTSTFMCTTHSCCPPYQKFGNVCKLGLRARRFQ